MGLVLYNLLLPVYLLVALPGLLLKMKRRGGYGRHFGQRFACYDSALCERLAGDRPVWWIHAVSVGEVLIAMKLIERIRERASEHALILSTTSSTGYATACQRAPQEVSVIYNPLDLPGVVQRSLRKLRPSQIVLMESELWPNLITAAAKRGIPVSIANARLSPRSGRRYARFRRWVAPTLNRLQGVWTQEEGDSKRWEAAGLEAHKIERLGSIKFDPIADRPPREDQVAALRSILDALWGDPNIEPRRVMLLGSSHAGEERRAAELYLRLRETQSDLRLVLVPRHFERAESVLSELQAVGISVRRRSQESDCKSEPRASGDPEVLLVDTTGELRAWYGLADMVVVGKSFEGRGGQNPVEPILAGRPVVVGPHMENFAGLTARLVNAGGMAQVADWTSLFDLLDQWVRDPASARQLVDRGQKVLAEHAGATDRTVDKMLASDPVTA